jgi:hypothetical protein
MANKVKTDANGQVPLYARVTVNGKRAEISLKKKIDPIQWDVKRGNLKGSSKDIKTTNSYISQVRNDLFEIYVELKQLNGLITAEQIKDKYTGEGIVHRMLLKSLMNIIMILKNWLGKTL